MVNGIKQGRDMEAYDAGTVLVDLRNFSKIVEYMDENSLVTSYDYLGFDTFKDTSKINSFDGKVINSKMIKDLKNTYDDFEGGSQDATKWTSFAGGGSTVSGTDGFGVADMDDSAGGRGIISDGSGTSLSSTDGVDIYFFAEIEGSTNTIRIGDDQADSSIMYDTANMSSPALFKITNSSDVCNIYRSTDYGENYSQVGNTNVDVSSHANQYIIFEAKGGTDAHVYVHTIGHSGPFDDGSTETLQSETILTCPETITGCFVYSDITGQPVDTSFTFKVSVDGGANYEEITSLSDYTAHEFTNTGTVMKVQVELDTDVVKSTPFISKYYIQVYTG